MFGNMCTFAPTFKRDSALSGSFTATLLWLLVAAWGVMWGYGGADAAGQQEWTAQSELPSTGT